jgi:hypothetical protein
MKQFKELTGYNANKFVKNDHVFILNVGTFYESEELAIKHSHFDPNIFVGVHVSFIIHEGVKIYRTGATNVWD